MVSGLEMPITRRPRRPLDAPPLLFVHGAYCAAWVWEEYFCPGLPNAAGTPPPSAWEGDSRGQPGWRR